MTLLTGPRRALLRRQAVAAPPAGFVIQGINFRTTLAGPSGFPGDSAGFTYSDGSETYTGAVIRGGQAFGWYSTGAVADALSSANEHAAGTASCTHGGALFILKLKDGPGTYNIWVMNGNTNSALTTGVQVQKGAAFGPQVGTITDSAKLAGQYQDFANTLHASYAAFMAGAVPLNVVLDTDVVAFTRNTSNVRSDFTSIWAQRVS